MATIVPCDAVNITRACQRLSEGFLVAFPTETVYGLGANALNADAVLKIFQFKGRPATDPLIVHVPSLQSARALINVTVQEELVLQCMSNAFWPGPLTCVVRASHLVPSAVTSGSGYVGIRVPSHPTAMALLKECDMPIAAPSANRFGHVSPTSPHHVVDDFAFLPEEVLVLDAPATASCIGMESTVFKIVQGDDGRCAAAILRSGFIGLQQLQSALDADASTAALGIQVVRIKKAESDTSIVQEAPGQLLRHYSPDIPTYFCLGDSADADPSAKKLPRSELSSWVVIDLSGLFSSMQHEAAAYFDLGPSRSVTEVTLMSMPFTAIMCSHDGLAGGIRAV
jgi:L-threonylcarbamoyladenylate synthase